jgi:phosphoribosylformylglycinamidine cyclo-ligase
MNTSFAYKQAGVDLIAGDDASRIMFEASKATWANRRGRLGEIATEVKWFSDLRYFRMPSDAQLIFGMNFDGVGTKIEVAERVGCHTTVARDLFAMVCDDAAVRGAEPIAVGSILDCNRISIDIVRELASGMIEAAALSDVAVINGEVAELGNRVGGYGETSYNWGAAAVWAARTERLLGGERLGAGHSVVAVRERGLRSNGLSLVRKLMKSAHGDDWHTARRGARTVGDELLTPSVIYTPLMTKLTGGCDREACADVSSMTHITGGGVPGKLSRTLRTRGLGARLENLFPPADILIYTQEIGDVSDADAYRTWNMGQGLLLTTSTPNDVLKIAQSMGFEAQVAGSLFQGKAIEILSRGRTGLNKHSWLTFPIE